KSEMKGKSEPGAKASPSISDRKNIGSQINSARDVARRAGRANSGLIKPDRTISLKNGPPFVREKLAGSKEAVCSTKIAPCLDVMTRFSAQPGTTAPATAPQFRGPGPNLKMCGSTRGAPGQGRWARSAPKQRSG